MNFNAPTKKKRITEHIIQQVRDLDILDALAPYLNITKNGSGNKAICPFHNDSRPSLSISPSKGLYKCFVCGAFGTDAINVVMKVKSVEFLDAIKMIAADHKIEIQEEELTEEQEAAYKKREAIYYVNQWAATWFEKQLKLQENIKALQYVQSRWNDKSIETFCIGYAPSGKKNLITAAGEEGYHEDTLLEAGLIWENNKIDCFQDRIMFPVHNKIGKVSGFSGRSLTPIYDESGKQIKKYINTRDTEVYAKSEILFGFHSAKRSIKAQSNVYLVEGNADVIRLNQIGIPNCVALSGTSLTIQQIEELNKITEYCTLIPDMDTAGEASASRSAKLIIEHGLFCKIIPLPASDVKQDPDSFFTDKDQFYQYENDHKKDYIFHLAEKQKEGCTEPDQIEKLIANITSLVLSLPESTHVHYFAKLGTIMPPKSGWKGKNIKGAIEKHDLKLRKDNPVNKSEKSNSDEAKHDHDFYYIEKDREGQFKGIKIDRVKFIEKLKEKGYLRFDAGIDSFRFLKAKNNTITEVSTTLITDDFISFIDNLEGYQHEWEGGSKFIDSFILKRKIFDGIDTFFSPSLLRRLNPDNPISIKKDTRNEKFIFYQNGFVSVSADGCKFNEYQTLDTYIWSNQILNRNFDTNVSDDDRASIFLKFIWNICNQDEDRFLSMQTIMGYVLHNFMDCKLFAVILTDSKISEDGEPNGRTGKTLWGKGLSHMLNTDERGSVFLELNGKDFSPKNKFKYEDANLDTQLIHINDIYNNYNIENSFNDITEGIKIDKKNEKPITIQPKLIFSSNKTIKIEGESAKDRVIQFEFSEHYNSEFNPSIEFGSKKQDGTVQPHWFFTDWDQNEWSRFDYFMINCITKYFQKGLIRPKEINLSKRTLADHTSSEFINFMTDAISVDGISNDFKENGLSTQITFKIEINQPFSKRIAFEVFIKLNPDFNNQKFKQRDFTKWIRMYAKHKNKAYEETRSHGNDLFTFIDSTISTGF